VVVNALAMDNANKVLPSPGNPPIERRTFGQKSSNQHANITLSSSPTDLKLFLQLIGSVAAATIAVDPTGTRKQNRTRVFDGVTANRIRDRSYFRFTKWR